MNKRLYKFITKKSKFKPSGNIVKSIAGLINATEDEVLEALKKRLVLEEIYTHICVSRDLRKKN